MIIAQLTDTHILVPNTQSSETAKQRIHDLKACISDINNLEPLPDAVIHTGDMTQTADLEEYKLTLKFLKTLRVPCYVVPGNRDSRTNMRYAFKSENFITGLNDDPVLYEVDKFRVRLIGFDTLAKGNSRGDICTLRMRLLDKMLESKPNKPTAIFMHHPPIPIKTPTTNHLEFSSKNTADAFLTLIMKHQQVCRVFCGHTHIPYITKIGNTEFSTVPSVASDLRKGSYPLKMNNKPLYQIHKFSSFHQFVSETRLVKFS